jgi:hypothetical protein
MNATLSPGLEIAGAAKSDPATYLACCMSAIPSIFSDSDKNRPKSRASPMEVFREPQEDYKVKSVCESGCYVCTIEAVCDLSAYTYVVGRVRSIFFLNHIMPLLILSGLLSTRQQRPLQSFILNMEAHYRDTFKPLRPLTENPNLAPLYLRQKSFSQTVQGVDRSPFRRGLTEEVSNSLLFKVRSLTKRTSSD